MPSDEDSPFSGWGDDYVCHCDIGIVTLRRKELDEAFLGMASIVRYGFECRCGCTPLMDIQEAE